MSDVGLDEGGIAQAFSDLIVGIASALNKPVLTRKVTTTKTSKKGVVKTSETNGEITGVQLLALYFFSWWVAAGRPNLRDMFLGDKEGLNYTSSGGGLSGMVIDYQTGHARDMLAEADRTGAVLPPGVRQAYESMANWGGDPAALEAWRQSR